MAPPQRVNTDHYPELLHFDENLSKPEPLHHDEAFHGLRPDHSVSAPEVLGSSDHGPEVRLAVLICIHVLEQ